MRSLVCATFTACALLVANTASAATYILPSTTLPNGSVVTGTFDYDTSSDGSFSALTIHETGTATNTYTVTGGRTGRTIFGQTGAVAVNGDRVFYVNVSTLQSIGTPTVRLGIGACNSVVSGLCRNASLISQTTTATVNLPPAAVPTVSEWAMILLGLALAGGATLTIQRRRFTA